MHKKTFFLLSFLISLVTFFGIPLCFVALVGHLLLLAFFKKREEALSEIKVASLVEKHLSSMPERKIIAELERKNCENEKLILEQKESIIQLKNALEKSHIHLLEQKKTVALQRELLETQKKQQLKLQKQVKEPFFKLTNIPASPSLKKKSFSPFDLLVTLRKHKILVENYQGAQGLGGRFFKDKNFLNKRLLAENFQAVDGIFFLFSLTESKVLFATNSVKKTLGISTEKFTKDFEELVVGGFSEFKTKLQTIPNTKEESVQLLLSKNSNEHLFQCVACHIDKGPFSNTALVLLYPFDKL